MIVNNFKDLPDGGAEVEIVMTVEERELIKWHYGWKRLTHKRVNSWLAEVLEDYCNKVLGA